MPSEIYGVEGAAGLLFDKGIFYFGKHVDAIVEQAGQDALSPGFARSAQARAFAKAMGDDMTKSAAGYADPGGAVKDTGSEEIIAAGF